MGDPPVIAGYRVLGRLGGGAQAEVWRAVQEALGREVALKVMAPALAADAGYQERFLREARAAARIGHPQVVAIYDAGRSQGGLFLALEYCPGGDLDALLAAHGGHLPLERALQIAGEIAAALEAVEAAGLVHRDLKPANVLLDGRGAAKLGDLGLARAAAGGGAGLTTPGMVVGTPLYMAPEQARAAPDLDIRADLWSLGATLYRCLAGEPPFPAPGPAQAIARLLAPDPAPDLRARVPAAGPGVAAVVARCLDKDRDRRFRSAAELRAAIEGLLGLPPRGRPSPGRLSAVAAAPADNRAPSTAATRTPSGGVPAITPSGLQRALADENSAQLAALARRVMVDADGMAASIVLGPGASFVRPLLERILAYAGIVHGVVAAAYAEAARPSASPRRILLARGDLPAPGMPGRTVHGEAVPPLASAVAVRVADDAMEAVALTRPGALVPRADLEAALRAAGIAAGFDAAAVRRLIEGPAGADGRTVVARGRAPADARPGGFAIEVAAVGIAELDQPQLPQVVAGQAVARWHEGVAGSDGCDVRGRLIAARHAPAQRPEDYAGEGVELARDGAGYLVLRALQDGICQQQPDGAVRVVRAREIAGDLGPGDGPLVTDDLVIVRGSVLAGASVQSASDVVVLGDVHEARIVAGGAVQVAGLLLSGQAEVVAGGVVLARGAGARRIMAGSVRIDGEAVDTEIIASGSVTARRAVGGRITAAGDIRLDHAGERDGRATELWAGHHLAFSEQAVLADLSAQRLAAERARLLAQSASLEQAQDAEQRRGLRLGASGYTREDVARQLRARLARIEHEHRQLQDAAELARQQLARHRQAAADLAPLADNARACLEVRILAHPGTVLRLADGQPEILREPRMGVRLGA